MSVPSHHVQYCAGFFKSRTNSPYNSSSRTLESLAFAHAVEIHIWEQIPWTDRSSNLLQYATKYKLQLRTQAGTHCSSLLSWSCSETPQIKWTLLYCVINRSSSKCLSCRSIPHLSTCSKSFQKIPSLKTASLEKNHLRETKGFLFVFKKKWEITSSLLERDKHSLHLKKQNTTFIYQYITKQKQKPHSSTQMDMGKEVNFENKNPGNDIHRLWC